MVSVIEEMNKVMFVNNDIYSQNTAELHIGKYISRGT